MERSTTVLDGLAAALRRTTDYNREDKVAPACILWPDKNRQWERIIPLLAASWGPILTLGPWNPPAMTGPAIWIKTLLARKLEGATWARDAIPIIYLPGVARADLRSAEDCPAELLPLVELLFRGTTFAHSNGRDWSIVAFLRSASPGPALDVDIGQAASEAAVRAADILALQPVDRLRGRHLEASDFDQLLVEDVAGQVLRWLDAPDATKSDLGAARWSAFKGACLASLAFDPDTDGRLVAAERLAAGVSGWNQVWQRYAEAPARYPALPAVLDQVAPAAGELRPDRYPSHDAQLEARLRAGLLGLAGTAGHVAAGELRDWEGLHASRRSAPWASLGRAPLARALEHLAVLATVVADPTGPGSADDLRKRYVASWWQADRAVLLALAAVKLDDDVRAVTAAIQAVYLPWLSDIAAKLQKRIADAPAIAAMQAEAIAAADGECLVFADGLRLDVGNMLAERLRGAGCNVEVATRWAGLPTVTATCKVAVSPVAATAKGGLVEASFEAQTLAGKALTAAEFRNQLKGAGLQILAPTEVGDATGKAWTETGALDKMGHEQQWKLAWRIEEELAALAQRVQALLDAGWSRVRVVTDHGWLLVPGGLPTAQLPVHATETKWSRCAVVKDGAEVDVPTGLWSWSTTVRIAVAPGVSTFRAGYDYAHGGWSLQEAVVPVLEVTRSGSAKLRVTATAKWTGMRCNVEVQGAPEGSTVDIRLRVGDASSTRVETVKPVHAGPVRLFVRDERDEGLAAFLVVIGPGGSVVHKEQTVIGGKA